MFSRFLFKRNQMAFASPLHRLTKAEKWRMAGAMYAGKIGGLMLVLAAIHFLPGILGTAAHAQSVDSLSKALVDTKKQLADTTTTLQNTANTIWTLVAAFLVFGMQPGFVLLEAGFARSRETVNILLECIFDTCLCGILFWAFGYAFMFSHGNGFIGTHWFFLSGADSDGALASGTYLTTGVPIIAHWIFQYAFADGCDKYFGIFIFLAADKLYRRLHQLFSFGNFRMRTATAGAVRTVCRACIDAWIVFHKVS